MAYTYGSESNCKLGSGSSSGAYVCRVGYQVNSQDVSNNTSNVTLRLEVKSTNSSYKTYGYNQTSTIDGTTLSAKSFDMRSTNSWQLFGERTITISHNADGTYSSSKSASFTTTASGSYSLKSGSASVTVAPATIPRATTPTVSSSSVAMGSSVTISTPRASSSFTHTLTYSFGSTSGTIASNVGTSQSWTPPLSLANQVPNSISGTCTITCETYDGNTLIGTKTVNLTLNVPSSVVPSISSVTLSEGNSTMSSKNWGVYVQNKSQLRVKTVASGSYSSTIKSYKITGIDDNTYNSSDFTSNALTGTGSKTIKIQVTDSRGRTASTTKTYNCVAYGNPTISNASAVRCNQDGTSNEEGTYLKYTFNASVSAVSNKNSHIFKIGYKTVSSSSYKYVTISNDGYTLSKNNVVLSGVTFSADSAYDIVFSVQDAFTTVTKTINIATAFALINYNASGKAMAFGKVSEAGPNEKLFELDLPTIMRCLNLFWKEEGWGDEFSIQAEFSGYNDSNLLKIMGAVGGEGETSTLYDLMTISAKSGNVWIKGLLNGYSINAASAKSVKTLSAIGDVGWSNQTDGDASVISKAFMAWWNGAFNNANNSNLKYCSGGEIQAKPKSLYDNGSGTTGTVTLSETSEHFTYLEIFYKNEDGQFSSTRVYSPNGKTTNGTIIRKNSDNTCIMLNSVLWAISGTSITPSRNSQANIYFGGSSDNDTNTIRVVKVIGYK